MLRCPTDSGVAQNNRGTVWGSLIFPSEIGIFGQNSSFVTGMTSSLRPLRAAARPRRPLLAQQETVGHRSARFRPSTHPLSGCEQSGDNLGEFDFRSKNHHFHGFPGSGRDRSEEPCLVIISLLLHFLWFFFIATRFFHKKSLPIHAPGI